MTGRIISFVPSGFGRLLAGLLVLGVLLMLTGLVMAQDTPLTPVVSTFDLQAVLAAGIAFLLYTLTLAGAVQTAINSLKPLFLDPIKASVSDSQYLIVMYVFRALVTAAGYLWLWGGVPATRAVVPILPAFVPDVGVGLVTVVFVVLGEEVIHPVLDRLYALRDAAKLLGTLPTTTPQQE